MHEVSCRALDPFFQAVDRRRIPRARLTENVGYSLEQLQNRHERIEWDAFRRFMTNVRAVFSEAELVEIGAVGLKSPGFRSFALIGRTLFSASGFYRWMLTSGGMGNQLFSNMSPSFRELRPGRIDLDLQVAPGYEPCPDFFYFASGGFQALPELVGLARANVKMVWIDRGARFQIEFEASDSRRARLLRRLTRSTDARATAKELNETISVLEARNEELEAVRARVELQRERLDIAYTLGSRIWAERNTTCIANKVTESLVGALGTRGARIVVHRDGVTAEHGDTAGAPSVIVDLPGSPSPARLECWAATDTDDAKQLADLVAPTIALAITNAIADRELAEYQAGLEKIVDQRTTELRAARDELTGLVEQLRAAQDARERFFSNISHEIRTPLSLILLATSDIEKRAGHVLDDRSRGGLASVTDSARKLVRLVDELLLLAAGQADKLVLSPEPTDVAALCAQLAAAWRPAAEASGLTLEVKAPLSLFASVDPVAFERVASNLLSNAVKYTPSGGRIEIELDHRPEGLVLAVRDTGRGIDPDLAARLFGRFERAAGDDRRKAGTGIGLALVKQLVEGHDGTVTAIPRATGGTEFLVVLPGDCVISDVTAAASKLRVTHAQAASAGLVSGMVFAPEGVSQGTILIAEDEPRLARSIAELLAQQYTVVVALDGLAAIDLVHKHQPQLLITDVDMPGMNGIELSRKFREITGDRLAPIVILSAVIDLRTRVMGLEAGAVDYVGKPFDPAELKARVQAQFRMRDLALRLHRAEQLSALGILTSGLAHELRNPANGIVNALEPMVELLPPDLKGADSPVGQLLEVMKSCADQIAFLTRQLLGFRNNTDLDLRSADMPNLVQRAMKLASSALNGIEVRTNLQFSGPVLCAPPLLLQVLTNLIENAGHAAGSGGWVEVNGTAAGPRVTIEISDSGPGVPVELRERVFEPFFTTKSPGAGTGLGLSVARTIVHRHRGTLEIRQKGAGTAFVIELPGDSNFSHTANAV